jgi:hypothetical protein
LSIHRTNIIDEVGFLDERWRNLPSLSYVPLYNQPSYYDSDYEYPEPNRDY